jgi:hypothetical protein
METLPTELHLQIFAVLPDFAAVTCLAMTSQYFRAVYSSNIRHIHERVLAQHEKLDGLYSLGLSLHLAQARRLAIPPTRIERTVHILLDAQQILTVSREIVKIAADACLCAGDSDYDSRLKAMLPFVRERLYHFWTAQFTDGHYLVPDESDKERKLTQLLGFLTYLPRVSDGLGLHLAVNHGLRWFTWGMTVERLIDACKPLEPAHARQEDAGGAGDIVISDA